MTRKKLIYVAGPISKGSLTANIMKAHQAGMALFRAGLAVIVPHGSVFWGNRTVGSATDWSGGRWDAFLPEALPGGTTHADWMGCDLEIVRRCDCVLRLPGESKGADMETALAAELGIPVFGGVEEVVRWAREKSE